MKHKNKIIAVIWGWAGICIVLIILAIFQKPQSHNATDPGPDVVYSDTIQYSYNYDSLDHIRVRLDSFYSKYHWGGDCNRTPLEDDMIITHTTTQRIRLNTSDNPLKEGYREFDSTFTIKPKNK